jgi:Rrf2 family protein
MKVSTRGRYGLRLLVDLARSQEEGHIPLERIAARQDISLRYLEQVVIILRRAGYIRSVKGAGGGYSLALPPEEIRVGDALRTLEGDMLAVDPPPPGGGETRIQRCIRETVYDRINARIAAVIDGKTLAQIAGASGDSMYFI